MRDGQVTAVALGPWRKDGPRTRARQGGLHQIRKRVELYLVETTGLAAPLASPLEIGNLLAQSLHCLPALPSSLLRASLIHKSWGGVVSDPRFLREFRAHHRRPPLLGFFYHDFWGTLGGIRFTLILDPPDRIPDSRFSLRLAMGCRILRCHHGRVLISDRCDRSFLVWDPITGDLRHVPFPPTSNSNMAFVDGGIACVSTEQGHVHGACHSDPFKVIAVGEDRDRYFARVYSAETGAWGDLFSIVRPVTFMIVCPTCPTTMLGNSICMLLIIEEKLAVLEVDWIRQEIAIVDIPSDAFVLDPFISDHIMATPTDAGGLSLVVIKDCSVHVWKRASSNGDGDAGWTLVHTVELGNLLSLGPTNNPLTLKILGLDEDDNAMYRSKDTGAVFIVTPQSKKIKQFTRKLSYYDYYPFASFYTPPQVPGIYLQCPDA
ncbi:unnamed protein product [Urochloa decumbens]|uniref:F-box protein AT5G49610-like beta-propeller domain-containing protein n=1 Tax=Urochloa decumbens TaxID=240449 RepID=A0ABC8YB43_9POAL